LPHLPSCAEAIPVLIEQDVIELFARNNVLSKLEMESRYEIYAEQYIKSVDVEAHLALQLFKTRIYPAAMEYIGRLSKSIESSEKVEVKLSRTTLNRIAAHLQEALALADELEREVGGEYSSLSEGMRHRRDVLLGLMEQLRMVVDQLEQELDDSLWPLPTYQEMLFVR
jgi:glutamine synthetase